MSTAVRRPHQARRSRARRTAVASLAAVATLVVAGCTPNPVGQRPEVPDLTAVTPLPRGAAHLAPPPGPTGTSDQGTDDGRTGDGTSDTSCTPGPTLRPSNRPAKDLISDIVQRGRIIVGTDQGSYLFSSLNPVTGQFEGFDIGIAREIARDIFGDPSKVEFRLLEKSSRTASLRAGTVDIVINTLSRTCDREDTMMFSAPYLSTAQRILTTQDTGIRMPSDLAHRRVCVARGSTSLERIRSVAPTVSILAVNSWADCLVAVQQQQTDAVTTDAAILAGLQAQDSSLEIVGPQLSTETYAVGASLDHPGLVRQVNKTIARILRDGTWQKLYQENFGNAGADAATSVSRPPAASYAEEGDAQ